MPLTTIELLALLVDEHINIDEVTEALPDLPVERPAAFRQHARAHEDRLFPRLRLVIMPDRLVDLVSRRQAAAIGRARVGHPGTGRCSESGVAGER